MYPCYKCNEQIMGKIKFKTHFQEHKILKVNENLECTECGQEFDTKLKIMEHIKQNHKILSFVCGECNVSFAGINSFRIHLNCKHPDKNEVKFPKLDCTMCSYSTLRKDAMKRHIKVTHNKYRYECNMCDYKAIDTRRLAIHRDKKHPIKEKQDKVKLTKKANPKTIKSDNDTNQENTFVKFVNSSGIVCYRRKYDD